MTRSRHRHPWLALFPAIIVIVGPGCFDPVEPPVLKVIKLRVVMLVEERANLDVPPKITGGCKLTRTEVTDLVNDLVKFGSNVDVEFDWNETIVKLESQCMRVDPIIGTCVGHCGLPGVPFNCPRIMDVLEWFEPRVVDHDAGGPLGLGYPGDDYDHDPCTVNIYFVGNFLKMTSQGPVFFAGLTRAPGGQGPDWVLINDLALFDPSEAADHLKIKLSRTLVHEVVCHWLPGLGNEAHPSPTSNNPCPDDLCVDGTTFTSPACFATYASEEHPTEVERPTKVGLVMQDIIATNPSTQTCVGGP